MAEASFVQTPTDNSNQTIRCNRVYNWTPLGDEDTRLSLFEKSDKIYSEIPTRRGTVKAIKDYLAMKVNMSKTEPWSYISLKCNLEIGNESLNPSISL